MQGLLSDISGTLSKLNQFAVQNTGDGMVQAYQDTALMATYGIDQATPDNVTPSFTDLGLPSVQAAVSEPFEGAMFSHRLGSITDEMADEIKHALTRSLITGDSMQDASDRVEKIIGDEDGGMAYRSSMIARTEIARAAELGRDAVYRDNKDLMNGDGENDQWLSDNQDAMCPWCTRRDGMTMKEIKESDPGEDPFGNDTKRPLHPHCFCSKIPALKSWEDLLGVKMPEDMGDDERGMRNEDGKWVIVPVQTFDQWKASRSNLLRG
jgi:hypothetical protein